MTTTTAVRAPQHATTIRQRYSARSGTLFLIAVAAIAVTVGAWPVAVTAAALVSAGAALLWALDVLAGRRATRHTWAAWLVAAATGGALLAVMYVALERILG